MWRKVRTGERVPTILLPEEYTEQDAPDTNQYESQTPDRPKFWQSGGGTPTNPIIVIANATDIKWRIGEDELRGMALEIAAEKAKESQQREVDSLVAFNEAIRRSFDQAKNKAYRALAKRLV